MTLASQSPPPTRRGLLGTAAALLAGTAVVGSADAAQAAAGDADAEVFAACDEFFAADRAVKAFDAAGGGPDDVCNAICDRYSKAERVLASIQATTPAGIRAKSEVAYQASLGMEGNMMNDQEVLAYSAVADMLGRPMVPVKDDGWAV